MKKPPTKSNKKKKNQIPTRFRSNRNISIIWDFDGTLTPDDSTTKVVEHFQGNNKGDEFWNMIKDLRGESSQKKLSWEHILASDAPIWMYSLGMMATKRQIPLNEEFFNKEILKAIKLYPNVIPFLSNVRKLEKSPRFKKLKLKIHHFIVSAGLQDLIRLVFPKDTMSWTFGCRYNPVVHQENRTIENVPVFCMDESMKTRSIFEICKGTFFDPEQGVNKRVNDSDLWCPFENMIYVGDGDTDIPALSLVRDRGGLGIAVYNAKKSKKDLNKKLKNMALDRRSDLITSANFTKSSELFRFIENRCTQVLQRYESSVKKF